MPTPVRIAAAGVTVAATLSDSPTAARIAAATVLAAVGDGEPITIERA